MLHFFTKKTFETKKFFLHSFLIPYQVALVPKLNSPMSLSHEQMKFLTVTQ